MKELLHVGWILYNNAFFAGWAGGGGLLTILFLLEIICVAKE